MTPRFRDEPTESYKRVRVQKGVRSPSLEWTGKAFSRGCRDYTKHETAGLLDSNEETRQRLSGGAGRETVSFKDFGVQGGMCGEGVEKSRRRGVHLARAPARGSRQKGCELGGWTPARLSARQFQLSGAPGIVPRAYRTLGASSSSPKQV